MCCLALRMLGRFEIRQGDRELDGLNNGKVKELFGYLLIYRDRPHTREALASMLWPHSTSEQSRKYLRQTLWNLQTMLGAEAATDHEEVLLADSDWVRFNPRADVWLDVAEFEQVHTLFQNTPGHELEAGDEQTVRKALALYRGDLLEGWYQDWCLFERERLQRSYLALLEKEMDYCAAHGDYETGLDCGTTALRYDPAHERTHRRLMRLHYLAGDRTAALRQYERCRSLLLQELGVVPSERTTALYEQVRAERVILPPVAVTMVNGNSSEAVPSSLDQALDHLKRLQSVVVDVERQLQQVIQTLEADLDDQNCPNPPW